jgi:hypothetical protein
MHHCPTRTTCTTAGACVRQQLSHGLVGEMDLGSTKEFTKFSHLNQNQLATCSILQAGLFEGKFDLLKYLLSELIMAAEGFPLFPPSNHRKSFNLPIVERKWRHNRAHISFYRGHIYFYTQLW